jgi:thymidylate synthase
MNNNIEYQYLKLLKDILKNGVEKEDRTGTGTISVFGRQIRHDMKLGFPLLTTKKMYTKGIISELLWFLQGRTDLRWLLEHDNTIWVGDAYKKYEQHHWDMWDIPFGELSSSNIEVKKIKLSKEEFINKIKTDDEFAKEWGSLGKIYGHQWRNWNDKIDQILDLIKQLKENPDSRRLLVSAWNPSDLPHQVLPPCHYGFEVYTRELSLWGRLDLASKTYGSLFEPFDFHEVTHEEIDKLYPVPKRAISLMFNMRSNDVPLGLPFNIASYALLLEIFGKMVNMIPDELIVNIGDGHIYKNQIDGIKEQLNREPYNLPFLKISDNVKFDGTIDDFLNSCSVSDFKIEGYESHPIIKMPLSN